MISIGVRTSRRNELVDITSLVQEAVRESGVTDGIVTVFAPHTTAGITINENADPDVARDIIATLNRMVPENGEYLHAEANSDAHIKASMMGFSVQVIIESGRLALGTWQGIYFSEFDGPRSRKVWISINSK